MHPAKHLIELISSEKGLWRKVKRVGLAILHTTDSADQIAGGVAIGLFVAFAVPPGVQLVAALSVAVLLRRNALAASLMVFVSNPLTMPFIYPFAAYLGSFITGLPVRGAYPVTDTGFWVFATNLWMHGHIMVLVMVGCFTIGAVASLVGYYASRTFVVIYRGHFARHGAASVESRDSCGPRRIG